MLIDAELAAITILLIMFLLVSTHAWRVAPELSGDSLDRYTRGETAKLEIIAGRRIFRIGGAYGCCDHQPPLRLLENIKAIKPQPPTLPVNMHAGGANHGRSDES